MSERLAQQVQRLAQGVASKFHRGEGRDDAIQQCVLQYLRVYQQVDTTQNPFNFVTCCFRNVIRQLHRVNRRMLSEYQDGWDGHTKLSDMRGEKCQSRRPPAHPRRRWLLELDNQVVSLWEYCQGRIKGQPAYTTVVKRIKNGWDFDKAIDTPLVKPRNLTKPPENLVVSRRLYWQRIKRGWSSEAAATTPKNPEKSTKKAVESQTKYFATLDGVTLSVREWCRRLGKNVSTVDTRIRFQKRSPEEALTMKPLRLARKDRK